MGFESFRVALQDGRVTCATADEIIRSIPHIRLDPESNFLPTSATNYVLNDGRHVIELQLWHSPVNLSCRFMLCHPPSVDTAFLLLVRELMDRLGMTVRELESDRAEAERTFSLAEFCRFAEITSGQIALRRAEWIAAFGPNTLVAGSREVFEKVILPQCTPLVEPAAS